MDLINTSLPLASLLAILMGALSFLSPCVLPVVPPYLAYMSGVSFDDMKSQNARAKVMRAAIMFVLGLSTVFILLGLAAARLGQFFTQYQAIFSYIAGGLILILGLNFLGILKIGFFEREMRADFDGQGSALGAYFLGLAFAFGWSPCLGPMLSAILGLIVQSESTARGIYLMGLYAIGLGLPFLLAALMIDKFLTASNRLKAHMGTIKKVMGAILVLVGLFMIFGQFTRFSFWLLELFPALGKIG